jgi:hypothetical protein
MKGLSPMGVACAVFWLIVFDKGCKVTTFSVIFSGIKAEDCAFWLKVVSTFLHEFGHGL